MSAELEAPKYWENYILDIGESVTQFWAQHLGTGPRDLLFILGCGFDPRTILGVETLFGLGGQGKREVLAITLDEGATSPSMTHLSAVETNREKLQKLVEGRGVITATSVQMQAEDGRRIGSRNAAGVIKDLLQLQPFSDVILDISALPRAIYCPLIAKILYLLKHAPPDSGCARINLHVLVSEDPALDDAIKEEGISDTASYVYGFGGGLEMESTTDLPKIWIPVLGEKQEEQLKRVYDLVSPNEICPLLPSPSRNPRRGDDLIYEYRELLFERLRVEPSNFVYAAERNPFEVYRHIKRTVAQFRDALKPLGGCKAVISAHSSKLLSLGVLLAAYELKEANGDVGIAHVESQGYTMNPTLPETKSELCGLWLCGECYEP
ncbi:MAG TPA: hypothetical protein VGX94_00460 [Terriglobia bacterium]|nr:hypothetical protein [Terriglobia bacterium]